jgi:hypothetical protein
MHKHKAVDSRDTVFAGPVATDQNRAAHGNITRTEWCVCGAVCYTNINGSHTERSGWFEEVHHGEHRV